MTEMTLGQRIAERRKMLSLSQEAFGEKMGVSRQAAFKWESDASIPEVDKLINMSRLFGVSVGWLLGEEASEQPAAEEAEEQPEQILFSFQPPEPQPELPETPVPPVLEPVPENPKNTRKPWLTIAFAAVASASLILSICSSVSLRDDLRKSSETNVVLQEQLSAQATQITDLENYYTSLNKRLEDLTAKQVLTSFEVTSLRYDLQALTVALGDGTILPDDSTPLPAYDNLKSWSLTAEADADISTVTLQFTATASVDIKGATLQVVADGSGHLMDNTIHNICTVAGRDISTTLMLPSANSYQYALDLVLSNGKHQMITLEGHGLSDLASLSQPTVRSTPKSVHVFPDKLYFSQGWFNVYLAVPYLMPKDASHLWDKPKICYYHNGELVEEYVPQTVFREAARDSASLSFEVYTNNYHMPRFVENDIHELFLEGTLTINGVSNEYSIPLRSWEIRQGEFVPLTE